MKSILLCTGVYPPDIGGPTSYVYALAQSLTSRGIAVTVLTYADQSGHRFDGKVAVLSVARGRNVLSRYIRYVWRAFRLGRQVETLYAQDPISSGLPAIVVATLRHKPFTMRVAGDYAWEIAQQRGETASLDAFLKVRHGGWIGLLERLERYVARRARAVMVPSCYLAQVVGAWGVPFERIVVVANAIQPLLSTAGREAERLALDVADKIVIFTVVRAVPWKGVGELVSWWKRLPLSHILVVAGDGLELVRWQMLAKEHGVEDRVRFLGRADRLTIARWYEASDAFVLASGYEGYPFVVVEATSRSLLCFVSDRGGNPETKETFPDLVTVLPYQNETAWVDALSQVKQKTSEVRSVQGVHWPTHEEVVDQVVTVLDRPSTSSLERVLMVSYDRGLLDQASDTWQRVTSLLDDRPLSVAVIARAEQDVDMTEGSMHAIGFSGGVIRRLWLAFIFLWREARRLPKRTVITAQDPFAAGWIGFLVSRLTNQPLEIQEHGDFFSGYWVREHWFHRPMTWLGTWLLRRAERVRVVSERVRDHVIARGVSPDKIEIISVSQDLQTLFDRPLQIKTSGTVHLVAPCRFVSQKGLDVLLEAVVQLKKQNTDFHLSLIGNGPLEASLQEQIRRNGLDKMVSIEPWRDPSKLWDGADIFVLSSRYEGWGRTVVEAMAAGVPVVATETGCVGSFFRPGVDGWGVPIENVSALALALQEAITQTDKRRHRAELAREQARLFPSRTESHGHQVDGWQGMLDAASTAFKPRLDLWVALFILFVIGSRLVSVFLFHGQLMQREWGFLWLVQNWFQGFGYSYATELGCLSAYRSPGYLFFLTALYSVFRPENTFAQALAQNIFAAGAMWLTYLVGKRLVGKRAALIGGFLMAAYPYTFYHYTQYYHTFLQSFFLLLLVWFLLRLHDEQKTWLALASGISIGTLAYVQGTILPVTPFIAVWLFWSWWPNWKQALRLIVIIAVLSAAVLAPWTYRNWKAFHAFVPMTTDQGLALFKANNEIVGGLIQLGYGHEPLDPFAEPGQSGYIRLRLYPEVEQDLRTHGLYRESIYWNEVHPMEPRGNVATCRELGPSNEIAYDRYWKNKAWSWMRAHPQETASLAIMKARTFWQPALFPSVKMGASWSFAGSSVKEWLARTSVTVAATIVLLFGWLGLLSTLLHRDRRAWLPFIILVVYTCMHMLFIGYTKYRIPLDHLLAVYAGWTIVAIWDRLKRFF